MPSGVAQQDLWVGNLSKVSSVERCRLIGSRAISRHRTWASQARYVAYCLAISGFGASRMARALR